MRKYNIISYEPDDKRKGCSLCCCRKDANDGNMFDKRRMKYVICVVVGLFVCGVIYLGYFCPARVCALSANTVTPSFTASTFQYNRPTLSHSETNTRNEINKVISPCSTNDSTDSAKDVFSQGSILYQNLTLEDLRRDYKFDVDGDKDVFVFLHMQKTGGTTFGRHLVRNIKLNKPCVCYRGKKRCDCENHSNHVWLFSRYSTGWRCGLHADWTELTSCVDETLNKLEDDIRYRRFLYITILRDPYYRFVSEFKHVHRGATWKAARLQCDGRQASLDEVPFCFDGDDWSGVTMEEFLDCPHNLANNRQTRMLANLSLTDCYGSSTLHQQARQCLMLESAKQNLRRMAFFGLTEFQVETQYMFEQTFGLKFIDDFFQYDHTHAGDLSISKTQQKRILSVNELDLELYRYAKELFFHRLKKLRSADSQLPPGGDGVSSDGTRSVRSSHHDDEYEEGDENFAEDDDAINHRINKRVSTRDRHEGLRHRKHTRDQ